MKDLSKEVFKFQPIFKQTPWGGNRIIAFKHLQDKLDYVGESWELSDVPGDISVVANGRFAGQTLTQLITQFKEELLGSRVYQKTGEHFPLLIKFIDAKQDLSIQVHPDDALAQKRGFKNGKTEMWFVVDAPAGSTLLAGFNRDVDKDEFQKRALDGSICEIINRHPVHPGSCFFLPAGQVHAICANLFLIEIQQTSDLTYRIYDYKRKGLDGKLRTLHLAEAEEAIDYHASHQGEVAYPKACDETNTVIQCPYFTTSSYELTKPFQLPLRPTESFTILICYQGTFTIQTEGIHTPVATGETVLIPAAVSEANLVPSAGDCRFLSVTI